MTTATQTRPDPDLGALRPRNGARSEPALHPAQRRRILHDYARGRAAALIQVSGVPRERVEQLIAEIGYDRGRAAHLVRELDAAAGGSPEPAPPRPSEPPAEPAPDRLEQLLERGRQAEAATTRRLAERMAAAADRLREALEADEQMAVARRRVEQARAELEAAQAELRARRGGDPAPRPPSGGRASTVAEKRARNRAIRAWARDHGWPDLPDKGVLRADVLAAYEHAHPDGASS